MALTPAQIEQSVSSWVGLATSLVSLGTTSYAAIAPIIADLIDALKGKGVLTDAEIDQILAGVGSALEAQIAIDQSDLTPPPAAT